MENMGWLGITIAVIITVSIFIFLGMMIQESFEIGQNYCDHLKDQIPGLPKAVNAISHFCEYNLSTGNYDFNRSAYREALSHVEM